MNWWEEEPMKSDEEEIFGVRQADEQKEGTVSAAPLQSGDGAEAENDKPDLSD